MQNRGSAVSSEDRGSETPPLAPGLYLVATPIGNVEDVTLRALRVLREADLVACEDTRHTGRLLQRYGIEAKLVPYHDHNAEEARPRLLARLAAGGRVALVSDAGTPLVSDPGYKLVRAARDQGTPVTSIPGACAAIAALQLSGMPPDRFMFAGFLPPRQAARRSALETLRAVPATLIFYESPTRLSAALADMAAVLGDRPAAVARELTKLFEEVRREPLSALAEHWAAEAPKGEIVIVVGPPDEAPPDEADLDGMLRAALSRVGVRDAAAEIAAATGLPRRQVYARALTLTEGKRR